MITICVIRSSFRWVSFHKGQWEGALLTKVLMFGWRYVVNGALEVPFKKGPLSGEFVKAALSNLALLTVTSKSRK